MSITYLLVQPKSPIGIRSSISDYVGPSWPLHAVVSTQLCRSSPVHCFIRAPISCGVVLVEPTVECDLVIVMTSLNRSFTRG